jgi:hypothetical protein
LVFPLEGDPRHFERTKLSQMMTCREHIVNPLQHLQCSHCKPAHKGHSFQGPASFSCHHSHSIVNLGQVWDGVVQRLRSVPSLLNLEMVKVRKCYNETSCVKATILSQASYGSGPPFQCRLPLTAGLETLASTSL